MEKRERKAGGRMGARERDPSDGQNHNHGAHPAPHRSRSCNLHGHVTSKSSWKGDAKRIGHGLQIVSERMTEKIVQGILDRFGTKNFSPKP